MVLRTRLELHDILASIPGVVKAYYSPPASVFMEYPCIRYELAGIPVRRADNIPYLGCKRYTLTVIDEDSESKILEHVLMLPFCSFDRPYIADGLNHFVFTLYF